MRTFLFTILIGASLCVACADEEAARRREVRQQFLDIMALIATADQGYVPSGGEIEVRVKVGDQEVTETRRDVQAFRQKILAQAAQKLKDIVKIGSESQKLSARRVLADVYASQARYELRQAMENWAAIANRSATVMSYLGSVDRADSRVRLFDTDERALLTELRKDRQATKVHIEEIETKCKQLRGRIETLTSQIRRLDSQSEQASQEAQRLHGKALVTTDMAKQYDVYDRSAKIDRQANVTSAAAQKLDVELDAIGSELVLLVEQQRIEQEAIKILDQQIAAAQQRQARLPYKQAIAEKTEAIEQLIVSLKQITDDYGSDVEGQLEHAAKKMNEAIDQIVQTGSNAESDERSIQLERLGHMTNITHVLTEHIVIAGSHGQMLAAIAQQAGRLMPDQSAALLGNAQRVYLTQRKLIEAAKQIISDAEAACDQISRGMPDGDLLAQVARQQSERLEGYRLRIDQQRLTPPQEG